MHPIILLNVGKKQSRRPTRYIVISTCYPYYRPKVPQICIPSPRQCPYIHGATIIYKVIRLHLVRSAGIYVKGLYKGEWLSTSRAPLKIGFTLHNRE